MSQASWSLATLGIMSVLHYTLMIDFSEVPSAVVSAVFKKLRETWLESRF